MIEEVNEGKGGKKRKMNKIEKILELVKEEPVVMENLEKMLEMSMLDVIDVVMFLKKYGLVVTTPTDEGGGLVQITPSGLQLLNLPDLPEGELPSDQLEVLEKHWGSEVDVDMKWLFLMQLKNKISCELGRSQGAITVNQTEDKFILTAFIPKNGGLCTCKRGIYINASTPR